METGEILSVENESLPERSHALLRISADVDDNRIQIDPALASALQNSVDLPSTPPQTRAVLQALLALDGQVIVTRSAPSAGPALEAGEGSIQILNPLSVDQLRFMRETLRHLINPGGEAGGPSMTVLFGSMYRQIPSNLYQGILVMNAEGQTVALEIGLPDAVSARGTLYRAGVVAGGTPVPVVVDLEGNLLHFETTPELNDPQVGALISYFGTPQNQLTRSALQAQSPFLIEMMTGTGAGNILNDLNSVFNSLRREFGEQPDAPVRSRMVLLQRAQTFGLVRDSALVERIEQGWRPLAPIEVEYIRLGGAFHDRF